MTSNLDLFTNSLSEARHESLGTAGAVLRSFATTQASELLAEIKKIEMQAPFRLMVTPGGLRMSVALTNCGNYGWVSDRRGYRYAPRDPESDRPWPPLPEVFLTLAGAAADAAGYSDFTPDACLVNRYAPGTRLSLHQDKNERDFSAPIVSVSLGLPAVFLFGGPKRTDPCLRIPLRDGDVAVWGGESRLYFHGVMPLKPGTHPSTGAYRFNLTLRKAH
ncbi:MAG: DNA oxidative demethylase AlkB [Gammaproteobacteria bacterium]